MSYELECACANIRRATRLITNLYNKELAGSGLETTQLTLIMVLFERGELNQKMLAETLGIDSTSLTRGLRPLVSEGLIKVRPGKDKREKLLSLTANGIKKYHLNLPKWEHAQRKLKNALTKSGWDKMFSAVNDATKAALAL